MAESNLQLAVTKLIQTKLNEAYTQITTDTNALFKCSTIYDFDYSEFKQYDENGKLITNQYDFHERYIPTFVENIIGDREPIPNCFVSEVTIPISMVVNLDNVDIALQSIAQFTNNCIAKVYDLDYEETISGSTQTFKIAFVPTLPDFSDFEIVEGETNKTGDFSLSAVISSNLNYGNQITYALSYDGGTTYENIVKIQPQTSRVYALHQDQVIGKGYTQASVQTETWDKDFVMYGYNNSAIARLLILITDLGETAAYDYTMVEPEWKLKITYNDLGFTNSGNKYNKGSIITLLEDLDEIVPTGSVSLKFKSNGNTYTSLELYENAATYLELKFGSTIVWQYNQETSKYEWVDDDYQTLELTSVQTIPTAMDDIIKTKVINDDITIEKEVLVTNLSYTDNIGDFISISFGLVDKL